MPSDDVSDLRDVVDAINKLCDTMKTSSYDDETFESCSQSGSVDLVDALVAEETVPEEIVLEEVERDPDWYVACHVEPADPNEVIFKKVEHYNTETWRQSVSRLEVATPEDVVVSKAETYTAETWRSPIAESEIVVEKTEPQYICHDPSSRLDIVYTAETSRTPIESENVVEKTEPQVRCNDPSSRLEIVSPAELVQNTKAESQDRWSDPSSRSEIVSPELVQKTKAETQDRWSDPSSRSEIVSPEALAQKHEGSVEIWSDSTVSLPGQIEEETVTSDERQAHEFSEMYYTASSEVSLLSDLEVADKVQEEVPVEKEDDRKECVIAGHVAAMRERFESMTRTNTPCPDLMRSASPALDVFRNITPSPDRLG